MGRVSFLLPRTKPGPGTWLIIVLNVGVFLWAESSGDTTKSETLVRFGANQRDFIWDGQYWRLLTAIFLHIGVIHLLWNCYCMLALNSWAEAIFGTGKFLFAYLLCGVAASAVSVLCQDVVSAGASGAGFGIIGILLAVGYRRSPGWRAFLADQGVRQWLGLIGLWFVFGIVGLIPMDNFAHAGGLAFGLLLGSLFRLPEIPGSQFRPRVVAVVGLFWVGLVLAACYPWPDRAQTWQGWKAMAAGVEAMTRGDLPEAIRKMDEAESKGYGAWQMFVNRGVARAKSGDNEGALRDLEEAVRRAPAVPDVYACRGFVHHLAGRQQDARADYLEALRIAEPDWPDRDFVQKNLAVLDAGNAP